MKVNVKSAKDSAKQLKVQADTNAEQLKMRQSRVPRSTASAHLSLMLLSFMSESRRMDNTRLKRELHLRLRYPTVAEGLLARAPGANRDTQHSATASRKVA